MFQQLSEQLKTTLHKIRGRGRLTEANIAAALREVRIALLQADVALEVTRDFIEQVKTRAVGKEVLNSLSPGQAVIKVVKQELTALMGEANAELNLAAPPPAVILMAGLQGVGKTTTAGKLAHWLKHKHRKKVLAASVDLLRPAAAEQLNLLAAAAGVEFFTIAAREPVEIAAAAVARARNLSMDVVLLDTAGRMHADAAMMQELTRLHTATRPVETLFVADSMSGQDAIRSARAFAEALPITGVVLTKTDGDARGGAALSVRAATGKPIKFLGVGEGLEQLEVFHPDRVAARILGMGDVLSLVESAERAADKKQTQTADAKLNKGRAFDLADMRAQLLQMEKMGGIASLAEKLPGAHGAQTVPAEFANTARTIAIINSMTPHERRRPAILRASRKQRIACGAGARVQDVNRLLKQFAQMQNIARRMRKQGGLRKMLQQFGG